MAPVTDDGTFFDVYSFEADPMLEDGVFALEYPDGCERFPSDDSGAAELDDTDYSGFDPASLYPSLSVLLPCALLNPGKTRPAAHVYADTWSVIVSRSELQDRFSLTESENATSRVFPIHPMFIPWRL